MDQLVGFLLHPHFLKLPKKLGKMSKYTPHFQSAFGKDAPWGVDCPELVWGSGTYYTPSQPTVPKAL